jgi:hypothetical protein
MGIAQAINITNSRGIKLKSRIMPVINRFIQSRIWHKIKEIPGGGDEFFYFSYSLASVAHTFTLKPIPDGSRRPL